MSIFTAPVHPGGRRPLRSVWTYADGTKVGPETDQTTAKLFHKMMERLTPDELRTLGTIVQLELVRKIGLASPSTIAALAEAPKNMIDVSVESSVP